MKSLCALLLLGAGAVCLGQTDTMHNRIEARDGAGVLRVDAVARDVIRLSYKLSSGGSRLTPALDPTGLRKTRSVASVDGDQLTTGGILALVCPNQVQLTQGSLHLKVEVDRDSIKVHHESSENFYGIRSYGLSPNDPKAALPRKNGLLRNQGGRIASGSQGDGGAPLAYTTRWGLLIDTIDGNFTNEDGILTFKGGSRKDFEAYLILGEPKRIIEAVTQLSGTHPMPPKWSLGFMNSQWGTDQKIVEEIIDEYQAKRIPIDAFIFDFDFKAWGEDDFGEWRWNSTSGKGAVSPNLFPDGASGKFAAELKSKGVHLMGIMKPRILTTNSDGNPTQAASEATANGYWMAKKPYTDYFSHRLANDIDFSKPNAREWYWKHSKTLFDTGIAGWWNDEADDGFGSLGHFQMQQALYEGQAGTSDKRVFSLNRNFYLGAQRYAYAVWSGDIRTGFSNMADQRARMLTMVGLAEPQWSMDTGGFSGNPTPENYARWMQFAAVTPIMRVHASFKKHRQPWVFGPIAEKAATAAIQLRYQLLPFFYSLTRDSLTTGVGIVRPMHWEYPKDPACANETGAWMLGDSILAAPVVDSGQTGKLIYLPEGRWFEYATGKPVKGGKQTRWTCDPENWSDIPMFVRGGSVIPTQAVIQHVGEKVESIDLNIWPDANRVGKATVYDDDGETVACDKGAFFRQTVEAKLRGRSLTLRLGKPTGSYKTAIKTYRVVVKIGEVQSAYWNGKILNVGQEITIPAGEAGRLDLNL